MYTLHHCNIFSLKCPTTHWNRAPKFKSAFFTSSKLWKLSNGFVLRLYHISFNVNLASQATKPFPQSCGAKYFSQQSPFIFLAQKSLYLANTFLGPAPRGVAALVSVSDDKIQITMLTIYLADLQQVYFMGLTICNMYICQIIQSFRQQDTTSHTSQLGCV